MGKEINIEKKSFTLEKYRSWMTESESSLAVILEAILFTIERQ